MLKTIHDWHLKVELSREKHCWNFFNSWMGTYIVSMTERLPEAILCAPRDSKNAQFHHQEGNVYVNG